MAVLIASKKLNSSDNNLIASFISNEFNCNITKDDIAFCEEDFEVESKKMQYYGSFICNY
jgi:hypothetical protein